LVSEIIEDGAGAVAGRAAAAGEEDVFGVRGIGGAAGAVSFRDSVAGKGAPVEFGHGSRRARGGAGFLGDEEAEAVIDVAIRTTGGSGGKREAVFGVEGV